VAHSTYSDLYVLIIGILYQSGMCITNILPIVLISQFVPNDDNIPVFLFWLFATGIQWTYPWKIVILSMINMERLVRLLRTIY